MAATSRSPRLEPAIDDLTLGLDAGPRTDAGGERRPDARPAEPGFVIRTDGAARGNPGPASCGAVLIALGRPDSHHPSARPDASISDYLGIRTNNVAEYTGVVRAVRLAAELGARRVELLLDSKLIVEQLAGRWRVKDAKLQPLWADTLRTLRTFPGGWTGAHVPRAQNSQADALANLAIDRVLSGGPESVVTRPR
jgi:ribonuclease HI